MKINIDVSKEKKPIPLAKKDHIRAAIAVS